MVVAQPNEQLVEPNQAMIESGAQRMEDEAPNNVAESAQPAFDYDNFTLADLKKLYVQRKKDNKSPIPTLEEVVKHFEIPLSKANIRKDIMLELMKWKFPSLKE